MTDKIVQYQSCLRNPVRPESNVWMNITEEGATLIRAYYSDVYKVRELIERVEEETVAPDKPARKYSWAQDGEGYFIVQGPNYPEDCFFRGKTQAIQMVEFLNKPTERLREPICYTTPEAVDGMLSKRAAGFSVRTFPTEGIEIPLYTEPSPHSPTHAEIAAAATQACLCRTGSAGWSFANTDQLFQFLSAVFK